MNWTQEHRLRFVLLAGLCIVGLAVAGCEQESGRAPTGPTTSSGEGSPVKDYPKDTPCPVCSGTLGEKGDPLVFSLGGPPIMVCSKDCVAAAKKDPSKYAPTPPAAPTE